MKKVILSFWVLNMLFDARSFAQTTSAALRAVVKISSIRADGLPETGAGIVVGQQGDSLFILTSLHVVAVEDYGPNENINLQFFEHEPVYQGNIRNINKEIDVAIISVNTKGKAPVFTITSASEPKLIPFQRVVIIGHPSGGDDWEILTQEEITAPVDARDERKMLLSSNVIDAGCSGGPVLTQTGEWIGMITSMTKVKTICIRQSILQDKLNNWKVPRGISKFSRYDVIPIPDLIFVKGGTFRMKEAGEDSTIQVTLNDFEIGKYEITVGEFKAFIDATGFDTQADRDGGSLVNKYGMWQLDSAVNWQCEPDGKIRPKSQLNHPVIHISWYDAREYCKWLSSISGKNYRLPTDAEWEYAAKGGVLTKNSRWAGTDKIKNLHKYANFGKWESDSWRDSCCLTTTPVGSFLPNELGIYDMSGNVCEFCEDSYYVLHYYQSKHPNNPLNKTREQNDEENITHRGFSWYTSWDKDEVLLKRKITSRSWFQKWARGKYWGFRVVRVP